MMEQRPEATRLAEILGHACRTLGFADYMPLPMIEHFTRQAVPASLSGNRLELGMFYQWVRQEYSIPDHVFSRVFAEVREKAAALGVEVIPPSDFNPSFTEFVKEYLRYDHERAGEPEKASEAEAEGRGPAGKEHHADTRAWAEGRGLEDSDEILFSALEREEEEKRGEAQSAQTEQPAAGPPVSRPGPSHGSEEDGPGPDMAARELKEKLRPLVEKELKEQLLPLLEEELKKELAPRIRAELETKLRAEIRPRVEAELRASIAARLREEIYPQVREQVAAELRASEHPLISQQMRAELEAEIREELRARLWDEVREEVKKDLRTVLEPVLTEEIREELRSKLSSEAAAEPGRAAAVAGKDEAGPGKREKPGLGAAGYLKLLRLLRKELEPRMREELQKELADLARKQEEQKKQQEIARLLANPEFCLETLRVFLFPEQPSVWEKVKPWIEPSEWKPLVELLVIGEGEIRLEMLNRVRSALRENLLLKAELNQEMSYVPAFTETPGWRENSEALKKALSRAQEIINHALANINRMLNESRLREA